MPPTRDDHPISKFFSRWLPGATLLSWAILLLYFFWSGRISAFLIPMFRPWVMVSGLLLLVLAYVAWILPNAAACCEDTSCSHTMGRMTIGRLLVFFVLLVPVYAALSLPHDGFGINTFENRRLILDGAALGRENTPVSLPHDQTIDPPELIKRSPEGYVRAEVIEFLYAASEPELRSDFNGEIVEVIGQVILDNETRTDGIRFKLVRMFMTCCAADARPVGVIVESDSTATLTEMSWVRVIGGVKYPLVNGKPAAVVVAREVYKTDPPAEVMLY